jgi:hypothetical protein
VYNIVACCLLPVACCLLPVALAAILSVAIGLKHFSINGAFICPLTVPHLPVNTLNVSRAVVGVCLLPWPPFCPCNRGNAALFNMGLLWHIWAFFASGKSQK